MAAMQRVQSGSVALTEEQKKRIVAEKIAQKKAELAAQKKEQLKQRIQEAAKRGDKAEVERILAEFRNS